MVEYIEVYIWQVKINLINDLEAERNAFNTVNGGNAVIQDVGLVISKESPAHY